MRPAHVLWPRSLDWDAVSDPVDQTATSPPRILQPFMPPA